jgi:hypothetical protein
MRVPAMTIAASAIDGPPFPSIVDHRAADENRRHRLSLCGRHRRD